MQERPGTPRPGLGRTLPCARPYLGAYDDGLKSLKIGLGHKDGGDKRHRTAVEFEGINYRDGETTEGKTREVVTDERIGWQRKHDNRLVPNRERVNEKIQSLRRIVQQAPNLHVG